MPSAAKKLGIVQNDDMPAAEPAVVAVAETMNGSRDGGGNRGTRPEHLRLLEALLFAAGQPLDEKTLARAACPRRRREGGAGARCRPNTPRAASTSSASASKWTFRTADDLSWLLTKETVETNKLSRAAIETLAIIAYHQPVTRAEIEEIRGVVMSKGTLDVLLGTGWISPRGRRKAPGRPITYGTTRGLPVAFRAGGGGRSARSRRAQGLRPARRQPAAGLCGADAVRRPDAARRRGPARPGRSRPRSRAAARARES